MSQDGLLPRAFAKLQPRAKVPWVSIVVLAMCWCLCLPLGLVRLFTLDVLLSGSSLILDFAALVALRIKEPNLQRPFRVPGGMVGATLIGVCPTLLLTLSAVHSGSERIGSLRGLLFRTLLIVAGFLVYWGMSAAR